MSDKSDANDYGATIKINVVDLKGPDAVRKRAKLFIGNLDNGVGLHNMICMVVEAALEEALAGFASAVSVTLNANGSATIRDDGRGIPIAAIEATMTGAHHEPESLFWGPIARGGWHDSLRSMGVSIVCGLSATMEVTNWREGEEHFIRFRDGIAEAPARAVGPAHGLHGTEITFRPSPEVFRKHMEFDYETLEQRLRQLAMRNLGHALAASRRPPHRDALGRHPV